MPHVSGSAKQANAIPVIKIDRDYITDPVNELISDPLPSRVNMIYPLPSRVNMIWTAVPGVEYDYAVHAVAPDKIPFEKTRFRILDDDGEVYYGGWLYNDVGCINQQIVLAWARDAGATEIQVKVNGEWDTQIG